MWSSLISGHEDILNSNNSNEDKPKCANLVLNKLPSKILKCKICVDDVSCIHIKQSKNNFKKYLSELNV